MGKTYKDRTAVSVTKLGVVRRERLDVRERKRASAYLRDEYEDVRAALALSAREEVRRG